MTLAHHSAAAHPALEADYLIIGSGAAGMAFADTLVHETDARAVIVDRHDAPGGYGNDAYPFVRRNAAIQLELLAQANSVANCSSASKPAAPLVRLDCNVQPVMSMAHPSASPSLTRCALFTMPCASLECSESSPIASVLDQGEISAAMDDLCIDCSANGMGFTQPVSVFSFEKITMQLLKISQPSFSAALIAHIEASYADDATKNGLCTVVPPLRHDASWLTMMVATMSNTRRWSQDAELMA